MTQAILKIEGKVQGVFYRAHTRDMAVQLGLKGYAKNMTDGTVEVLVQGSQEKIQELIDWCKQGSPSAQVTNIDVKWGEVDQELNGFLTH